MAQLDDAGQGRQGGEQYTDQKADDATDQHKLEFHFLNTRRTPDVLYIAGDQHQHRDDHVQGKHEKTRAIIRCRHRLFADRKFGGMEKKRRLAKSQHGGIGDDPVPRFHQQAGPRELAVNQRQAQDVQCHGNQGRTGRGLLDPKRQRLVAGGVSGVEQTNQPSGQHGNQQEKTLVLPPLFLDRNHDEAEHQIGDQRD